MKKSFYIFLVTAFFACTSTSKTNTAQGNSSENPELLKAQEKVPGITLERFNTGKKMYIRDCSGCHSLKDPTHYTTEQWHPILVRMFVKSKITDTTQKTLITDYVIAKSK